jgi:multicomponent Na+:H+ antiporter subunit D
MVLLVPLVQAGSSDGWVGGVVLAVSHAPAKAAALIATALIIHSAPGDAVSDLGGTAARRPIAMLAFGLAGLSLVGLPPSGGFVGKWYLLLGAIRTGQWWWIPVIVVGSLLTAAYLMRVVKRAFAPADDDAPLRPVRDRRDVIALLLALIAIGLGLRPTEVLDLLEVGAPLPVVEGG